MAEFDPMSYDEGYRERLADLRAECPVSRMPNGWWYFATFERVLAATQDIDTFLASMRAPGVVVPPEEQFINEIAPPRHGQVRRIINTAFATPRVLALEEDVREFCHEVLGHMLARGGGDLIADYVRPVPNMVMASILGAPPEDYELLAHWSDEVVEGTYPVQYRNDRGEGLAGAHPEFTAYVDDIIARRRAATDAPDDLLGRLLTDDVDGRRLTDVEARTQLVFLFISGNETTRHLIGNLLHTLATRPDLYRAISADRSLVPTAIEESLRMDSPIQHLVRDCRRDVELDGQQLHAGEKVVFGVASANRDADRFDDPDTFRLDRPSPRGHLAFGGGPHMCPGSNLARLEARVALEVLLDRVAEVRVQPTHRFQKTPVFWAYGPQSLPVDLVPRLAGTAAATTPDGI